MREEREMYIPPYGSPGPAGMACHAAGQHVSPFPGGREGECSSGTLGPRVARRPGPRQLSVHLLSGPREGLTPPPPPQVEHSPNGVSVCSRHLARGS